MRGEPLKFRVRTIVFRIEKQIRIFVQNAVQIYMELEFSSCFQQKTKLKIRKKLAKTITFSVLENTQ